MKKRVLIGAVILMTGVLSGCDSSSNNDDVVTSTSLSYQHIGVSIVKLSDGRLVECVTTGGASHAGITCDWDNAR